MIARPNETHGVGLLVSYGYGKLFSMKVKLVKLKCLRCGYSWTPKIEDVRLCAKCKSARWETPREK